MLDVLHAVTNTLTTKQTCYECTVWETVLIPQRYTMTIRQADSIIVMVTRSDQRNASKNSKSCVTVGCSGRMKKIHKIQWKAIKRISI